LAAGEWALPRPPTWRVHEREGKKGGLKEGERWPGPPKIKDRWLLSHVAENQIVS